MTITYAVYVTTTRSMPEGDPGILVQEYEEDGEPIYSPQEMATVSFAPGWGEDADGDFDFKVIDTELSKLGFERTSGWEYGGNQITAAAEKLTTSPFM